MKYASYVIINCEYFSNLGDVKVYNFNIEPSQIKLFMNKLLIENSFDDFELRECTIATKATFSIDGKFNKDWDENENKVFCNWSEIRPLAFEIIKGKQKPLYMKYVFAYSDEKALTFHPNAKACFVNIIFKNDVVTVSTGTAQIEFSMNHDLDEVWDSFVSEFFKALGITEVK